jgi:hypothetical protein
MSCYNYIFTKLQTFSPFTLILMHLQQKAENKLLLFTIYVYPSVCLSTCNKPRTGKVFH